MIRDDPLNLKRPKLALMVDGEKLVIWIRSKNNEPGIKTLTQLGQFARRLGQNKLRAGPKRLVVIGRGRCITIRLALLVAVSILAVRLYAQDAGHTITVPFEDHSGLIFLCVTLDKRPALLLLDTGSNVSFTFKTGAGVELSGNHFRTTEEYPSRVVFRYPDILKDSQGIIGQDVLRQFKRVRIEYREHLVELTQ